jgi:filamentous hemagglutinin
LKNDILKKVDGRFNYVVTDNNALIIGRYGLKPGMGHIDLARGNSVKAAGEAKVVNGELKYIDNSSGHYLPTGPSAQQSAENAFSQLGFDATGKYIEKLWINDSTLQRGGAWRPKL